MSLAGFITGFGDFKSALSLDQVASLLSSSVFGGIKFVEKDVDGEHDVGTLCLERDFVGIQVDLFGAGGCYTVEIGTRPSASVADSPDVCDLSEMLRQRLTQLTEVTLYRP